MSARTIARDAIVNGFENLKRSDSARVKDFEVSVRYLTQDETNTKQTYCVVMTDESRNPQTLKHDNYELTAIQVLYAHDTKDPRAKLDLMIEDAIETVLLALAGIKETVWKVVLETISTDEGSTAAQPWAQAVLRWSLSHRRKAFAA